jgi:hypothetical protein
LGAAAAGIQPKSGFRKYSDLRDKISFRLALTRDHRSCHVFQPLVTPSGRRRAVDGAGDGDRRAGNGMKSKKTKTLNDGAREVQVQMAA